MGGGDKDVSYITAEKQQLQMMNKHRLANKIFKKQPNRGLFAIMVSTLKNISS